MSIWETAKGQVGVGVGGQAGVENESSQSQDSKLGLCMTPTQTGGMRGAWLLRTIPGHGGRARKTRCWETPDLQTTKFCSTASVSSFPTLSPSPDIPGSSEQPSLTQRPVQGKLRYLFTSCIFFFPLKMQIGLLGPRGTMRVCAA